MARKPVTDTSAWPSLTLEGNLIAPAMIASIDRRQASEQTEQDYRIRKGLTIREEISTAFRVGQSHFDAFAKLKNPSVEATRRFARAFLAETFGFDDLLPADGVISFVAGGRVPVVVVPPADEKLDRRSPTLSTDRSRSPAFALQDWLNDSDQALWGLDERRGDPAHAGQCVPDPPCLHRSRLCTDIRKRGRCLVRCPLVADPPNPLRYCGHACHGLRAGTLA